MLSKMTVKELREVAERMNLKVTSRMLKAEIVALIQEYIDGWHGVALDMNKDIESTDVDDDVQVEQIRAWMVRHDMDPSDLSAEVILNMVAKDHIEALAYSYLKAIVSSSEKRQAAYLRQTGKKTLTTRQKRRHDKKRRAAWDNANRVLSA